MAKVRYVKFLLSVAVFWIALYRTLPNIYRPVWASFILSLAWAVVFWGAVNYVFGTVNYIAEVVRRPKRFRRMIRDWWNRE